METKEKILIEAKRIEEDSLCSSKGHFYAGYLWEKLHLWLGIPAAFFSAIAGASALSQFHHHNSIAGILAITVAALTAVSTFINPNEKANRHQKAGNGYNSLRNNARIFYEIEVDTFYDERQIVDKLNKLNKTRDKLNDESPQIPKWAFKKARTGIEEGEANYKVDK